MTASSSRPNEEPAVSASLPWQRRILAFFTMYGELSVACTPEEFAFVRTRLQREWAFDGGFVSRFTIIFLFNFQLIHYSIKSSWLSLRKAFFICHRMRNLTITSRVNAAMFAITPDSIFKVDSYARTAVAISSAACGLGIACDVWFFLRYNWVDLKTFIVCTLPNLTSSFQTDIVVHSTVPVTYMAHTLSSPCRHACPPSACLFLLSRSCFSWGSSHLKRGP